MQKLVRADSTQFSPLLPVSHEARQIPFPLPVSPENPNDPHPIKPRAPGDRAWRPVWGKLWRCDGGLPAGLDHPLWGHTFDPRDSDGPVRREDYPCVNGRVEFLGGTPTLSTTKERIDGVDAFLKLGPLGLSIPLFVQDVQHQKGGTSVVWSRSA